MPRSRNVIRIPLPCVQLARLEALAAASGTTVEAAMKMAADALVRYDQQHRAA